MHQQVVKQKSCELKMIFRHVMQCFSCCFVTLLSLILIFGCVKRHLSVLISANAADTHPSPLFASFAPSSCTHTPTTLRLTVCCTPSSHNKTVNMTGLFSLPTPAHILSCIHPLITYQLCLFPFVTVFLLQQVADGLDVILQIVKTRQRCEKIQNPA